MHSVGLLGNGEIGSSLLKVYEQAGFEDIVVRDPFQGLCRSLSACEIVNVCIPFHGYDKFVSTLKDLDLCTGCVLIIQSTIGVGCTDLLQNDLPHVVCAHSPVRGVHPNLTEGLMAFEKYVGVSDMFFKDESVTDRLTDHVKSLGMKPVLCRAKESELAKVVSTTLYGVSIAAITDVSRMCDAYGVDFSKVFTRWQTGYNSGYTALGKPNVCRPVLTPVPENEDGKNVIGGHCVLPNCILLKSTAGETNMADFVLRYSDQKGLTHETKSSAVVDQVKKCLS